MVMMLMMLVVCDGDDGAGGCADLARGCWEVVRRNKRLLMVMMLMRLVVCDGDDEAGVSDVYAVCDVYAVDDVDAGVGGEWDWHDGNVVIITPSPIRGRL